MVTTSGVFVLLPALNVLVRSKISVAQIWGVRWECAMHEWPSSYTLGALISNDNSVEKEIKRRLDFKLSPCSLCSMFSYGYFPGV